MASSSTPNNSPPPAQSSLQPMGFVVAESAAEEEDMDKVDLNLERALLIWSMFNYVLLVIISIRRSLFLGIAGLLIKVSVGMDLLDKILFSIFGVSWLEVNPYIAALGALIFAAVCIQKRREEKKHLETLSKDSDAPTSGLNRTNRIAFNLIREATDNFNEDWVIGVGGFGNVYKGKLKDGTMVAVKRRKQTKSEEHARDEFRTEIELLSRLHHRNLVSLIGYCDEESEMMLVYEYVEQWTLESHLHDLTKPPLTWEQRLKVCIAAARGLHYLHTGSGKAIIHRDVKSSNILVDGELVAKVSDFGLAKIWPELQDIRHISTKVKGTFGYIDPQYFSTRQLTQKSDVYSFGVVLIEVLCAKPAVFFGDEPEAVNLAQWAKGFMKKRRLHKIVDWRIADAIKPDSLRMFGEIVGKCLASDGNDRPSMEDILSDLNRIQKLCFFGRGNSW